MGALVSSLWRQQPREVIVIGLDAAGKTTMLQSMKNTQGGQIQTHVPTVGFLLETLDFQGSAKFLTMKAWDVGGRTFIRPLLRHWFTKTDGIIFVLDSTDRERFEDARFELHRVLGEEALHGKPLLVLANKQDLPAANITEVVEKLGLHSLRHRMWFIQETVATTGRGLWDGLDWLTKAMQQPMRETTQQKLPQLAVESKMKMEKDMEDDISTADTEDVSGRAEMTYG